MAEPGPGRLGDPARAVAKHRAPIVTLSVHSTLTVTLHPLYSHSDSEHRTEHATISVTRRTRSHACTGVFTRHP
eukprot:5044975-Prymnesium_polylepis.1